MKRAITISVFVFLVGIFTGLFFSTGISTENNTLFSNSIINTFENADTDFKTLFLSSVLSNFAIAAIMMVSILNKLAAPLSYLALWIKSFMVGFVNGIIYMNYESHAIMISLTRFFLPAAFLIPAFICMSSALFLYSKGEYIKTNRPYSEKKGLQKIVFICLIALLIGCIAEAICAVTAPAVPLP